MAPVHVTGCAAEHEVNKCWFLNFNTEENHSEMQTLKEFQMLLCHNDIQKSFPSDTVSSFKKNKHKFLSKTQG